MATHTIAFEKLRGRDNFNVWKRHVKSYLVIKGLWNCTQHVLTASSKDDEKEKDLKALSEITLLIDPSIFSYIDGQETAKAAWDALEKSLSETGLSRKVALLKQFTHTVLLDFSSMEQYVTEMLSLSSRVKNAGLTLDDEVIASIMLGGLPSEFDTFVMTIENTQTKLTSEYVKTTLLQESRLDPKSNDSAMFAKNKKFPCHLCKQIGHFAKSCPQNKDKKKKKKDKTKKEDNVLFASLLVNSKQSMNSKWHVDSGATSHMTNNDSILVNKRKIADKEVTVADNTKLKVNSSGNVMMTLNNGKSNNEATLIDVTHVPGLCTNLLSVSRMAANGNKVVFENDICEIFNKKRDLIGTASLVNGLYELNCQTKSDNKNNEFVMLASASEKLWHRRLGHICNENLAKIKQASIGMKISSISKGKCVVCAKGKQTRASFKTKGKRAENVLDLIHSDVCGPFSVSSHSGAQYYVTFVDDFSRKVFLIPIKRKSDVFDEFVKFKTLVENQCSRKIKILRTDNGTEYCNKNFDVFLEKHGIKHEKTVPYTPEQNGVAERMNRSIVERVRCMLIDSSLNKKFWAEAASTAAYLLNRIPCRGNDETPEERFTNQKPDLSHLKVFGTKAYLHIPKQKRQKLDDKSFECILMGYSTESKGCTIQRQIKLLSVVMSAS